MTARLDAILFAPGSGRRLALVRAGLAVVIGLRLALGPFAQLAGQPAELFDPPALLSWLGAIPERWILVFVQLTGVVGATCVVLRRWPRTGFVVAWVSLLLLAGLKGSLGKILHNDVLLLLAAVPLLAAPADARFNDRSRSPRFGWPVTTATLVIAAAYFFTGVAKLTHSGLDWVTGDNMSWILYQAAESSRAPTTAIAVFVAERPLLFHAAAAAVLMLELSAPLLLGRPSRRRWFLIGAAGLHLGTWLTLGLDYWAWLLTDIVVLTNWDRLGSDLSRPSGPPSGAKVEAVAGRGQVVEHQAGGGRQGLVGPADQVPLPP